ncbi:acyl-CoA thioesterase [Snuella sedimenti]|uniref:Acyl-CoA thioesterase n=1 Tax=Snuella sedimenti TaxID=2798802 RepID=A0A8J7JD98_9FLAO|nr:thioesterase family protein [Snuella sedimenti]MBJ6368914.1 acyl-CoA thioesterase [Snuella sedimenti]
MQCYEAILTVTKNDLDDLNHVNNVSYVQWVQNIAKNHWLQKASKSILDTYFWVMVSHFIEYKGEALLNDVIKLKTYITKSEGVKSTRIVEIINERTNELLAKSETTWCLIKSETKKPTRITQDIKNLFLK